MDRFALQFRLGYVAPEDEVAVLSAPGEAPSAGGPRPLRVPRRRRRAPGVGRRGPDQRRAEAVRRRRRPDHSHGARRPARRQPARVDRAHEDRPGAGPPRWRGVRHARPRPGAGGARDRPSPDRRPAGALLGDHRRAGRRGRRSRPSRSPPSLRPRDAAPAGSIACSGSSPRRTTGCGAASRGPGGSPWAPSAPRRSWGSTPTRPWRTRPSPSCSLCSSWPSPPASASGCASRRGASSPASRRPGSRSPTGS